MSCVIAFAVNGRDARCSETEVGFNDAQRANETVFALAMATGLRIHERVAGLRGDEIEGKDGLRQTVRCPSIRTSATGK